METEMTTGTPVESAPEKTTTEKPLEKNESGEKNEGRNNASTVEAEGEEKPEESSSPQTRKVKIPGVVPIPGDRPKSRYADIRIVKLESELAEDGKYRYNYESEDGTVVEQQGELKKMSIKNDDGEEEETQMGESVKGSYSYKDDEGKTYSITYTADENGYRPVGDHIPTIPPAIARALAWSATAKPWVDPWLVKQKKLREARAKKLEEQMKTTQKPEEKDVE
ncbi:endocuticle structural glycoprotein SgAbd-1-like [Contarinia nasturtii]|uniref:endocuticle structural glycoprotein SgAbd-1-like n=1 Tax=Contarinia nasturtii TaxID=265458 RepID=UPI0012D377BE|nr:endocuticle structural glycoprotein SgAbd-1-like [Contarinia nasturtii]